LDGILHQRFVERRGSWNVGFPPTFFFSAHRRFRARGQQLTQVNRGAGAETAPVGSDALERALAPVVGAFGLEVVDTEIAGGTLRVVVEGGEPIDLDRLAQVSAAVSVMLDERSELAPNHRYELEVSSPGLERRLRRPAHFAHAIGQRLAVRTVPDSSGDRRAEGVLLSADDEGFVLALDDGSTRRIIYAEVDRAHTIFDWKAALQNAKRNTRHELDAGASR
jgi:ribosome maturation factor RimP